jgi:hypothetical protein
MWDNVKNENHIATGYAGGAIYNDVKTPKSPAALTPPTPLHSWPRPHIGAMIPFTVFHRRHRRRLCGATAKTKTS